MPELPEVEVVKKSLENQICNLPIKGIKLNDINLRYKVKKSEINNCLFVTGGKLVNELELPYRKSGCAALDLAYVAAGRYDGYFQKDLNLWDIAAGIILVEEAGGIINEIDLSITKNVKIIASSTDIRSKLLQKLNKF